MLGSYCVVRVSESALRLILATILIVVGSKLAFDELHGKRVAAAMTSGDRGGNFSLKEPLAAPVWLNSK
jgi:hypothetical protein